MKAKQNLNFKIGETVVYPKHGVGEIVNIESMEISSIKTNFYVVKMEQAKLIIRVPLDKQDEVGLRKISTKKQIDEILFLLEEQMLMQLGLQIELEFPASLENELLSDKAKDGAMTAAQPNETTAGAGQ